MSEARQQLTIDDIVHQVQPQFAQIADRHKQVTWAEESQFALQACTRNPGLLKCAVETIQDAIINVAACGLTLNPAHGYAYLVPEYNTQSKRDECQLRISFKGLLKAATDSGSIKWVKADVVHANDTFLYKGPNVMPEISMNPFADRGEPVGVYCIAKTHDDEILIDTAPWSEVMKAKAAAKTQKVWDTWQLEMAKKFIIKRASKQWPKTDRHERLSHTVDVLNTIEGSAELEHQALVHTPTFISDEQVLSLYALLDDNGLDKDAFLLWLNKATKGRVSTLDQIKVEDFDRVKAKIEEVIAEQNKQ